MRRVLILITFLVTLIVTVSSSPVSAQNATPTPNPDCKPADVIKQAAALKTTGDKDKDLDALLSLADSINNARATCRGLFFKGTAVAKIIGPITLEEGTYKVTLTTKGYFILDAKLVSGSCATQDEDIEKTGTNMYNVSSGEANTGRETLLTSNGCKIILTENNISGPWTLTFEKFE